MSTQIRLSRFPYYIFSETGTKAGKQMLLLDCSPGRGRAYDLVGYIISLKPNAEIMITGDFPEDYKKELYNLFKDFSSVIFNVEDKKGTNWDIYQNVNYTFFPMLLPNGNLDFYDNFKAGASDNFVFGINEGTDITQLVNNITKMKLKHNNIWFRPNATLKLGYDHTVTLVKGIAMRYNYNFTHAVYKPKF